MSKKNKKKLTWKQLMSLQTQADKERIQTNLFFMKLSITRGLYH